MASKLPWRKFYYKDFTVDTQVLSVEACGAWIRILAFMNRDDDPTGSETLPLDGWAKVIGADEEKTAVILTELGSKHVAQINDGCDMSHNVTKSHSDVTVMSRRLVREHKGRDSNRLRKQKQRRHINVTELSQVRAEEESESELDKRSPKKETRQLGSQADLRAVFDYHCKVIGQAQNNDGPRQWRAVPGVLSKIKTRLKTFSVAEGWTSGSTSARRPPRPRRPQRRSRATSRRRRTDRLYARLGPPTPSSTGRKRPVSRPTCCAGWPQVSVTCRRIYEQREQNSRDV